MAMASAEKNNMEEEEGCGKPNRTTRAEDQGANFLSGTRGSGRKSSREKAAFSLDALHPRFP
jgi:hypothetical protein